MTAKIPAFRVCRAIIDEIDFADCSRPIWADDYRRAAEVYVELYLSELDYPTEVSVRVIGPSDLFQDGKLYDVTVVAVPEAIAKPAKSERSLR